MKFNYSLPTSSFSPCCKEQDWIESSLIPSLVFVALALGVAIQIVGASMNCVNTVVFFRIGLKDSVGLSFFVLSLSDFIYMTCNVVGTNACMMISLSYPDKPFAGDFWTFGNFFVWYIILFKDYTLTISAFIAVARCCLVALPFQFRTVFTLYRTCVCLVAIFLAMVVIHMPMLFTQGMELVFDPLTNYTHLVTWQDATRKDTLVFYDVMVRNFMPYLCLIIIASCLVILTVKLSTASKFRKSLKKINVFALNLKSSERELSNRDIRVIKAVCFISGSYFLGFLPTALQSFFRAIFPEFNLGKTYSNSFYLVLAIAVTVSHFNSAINIIFYWMFNTKFREELNKILPQVC